MIVTMSTAIGDLVINSSPAAGSPYWLEEGGLAEPSFDPRNTFSDDSPDVGGTLLLQSVLGVGTLGLTVFTTAADLATLKAQKVALEAAVRQFTFTASLDLYGVADTYAALPGQITWGTTVGMHNSFMAKAVISILVQPSLEA